MPSDAGGEISETCDASVQRSVTIDAEDLPVHSFDVAVTVGSAGVTVGELNIVPVSVDVTPVVTCRR